MNFSLRPINFSFLFSTARSILFVAKHSYCHHEKEKLSGIDNFLCPACVPDAVAVSADGNRKLYRFNNSITNISKRYLYTCLVYIGLIIQYNPICSTVINIEYRSSLSMMEFSLLRMKM